MNDAFQLNAIALTKNCVSAPDFQHYCLLTNSCSPKPVTDKASPTSPNPHGLIRRSSDWRYLAINLRCLKDIGLTH